MDTQKGSLTQMWQSRQNEKEKKGMVGKSDWESLLQTTTQTEAVDRYQSTMNDQNIWQNYYNRSCFSKSIIAFGDVTHIFGMQNIYIKKEWGNIFFQRDIKIHWTLYEFIYIYIYI